MDTSHSNNWYLIAHLPFCDQDRVCMKIRSYLISRGTCANNPNLIENQDRPWKIMNHSENSLSLIIKSVKHSWAFGTPPWLQNEVSLPMSWRGRFYNCRKICIYSHCHYGDSPPCLIFHLYFCFCFLSYENKIKSCFGESECPPLCEAVPRWPHLSRTFLVHFLEFSKKRGMGKHFPRSP